MPLTFRYPLLYLVVRPARALVTLLGIALVAGVVCYLLSLAAGLRTALMWHADPRVTIVVAEAATAESNSAIRLDEIHRLSSVPGLAQDEHGRPLVSPEIIDLLAVTRRSEPTGPETNVLVRGVDTELALAVHQDVHLVAGRWFEPGTDELVVGAAAARQFAQATLGSTLTCGSHTFRIVGTFAAAGTAHESELWGWRANTSAAFHRTGVSSAAIRLCSADPATTQAAVDYISGAAVGLRAIPEPAYFAAQAGNARLLELLAAGLGLVMGIGAVFAAMNTMYAAVAARTREIGMLRAIGFTPGRIVAVFLGEALALTVAGGVLGCLLCGLRIWSDSGLRDLVGSNTYTSVAFQMRLSPLSVALSLAVAALIGLVGGYVPARAAGRVPVTVALRAV